MPFKLMESLGLQFREQSVWPINIFIINMMVIHECHVLGLTIIGNDPCSFLVLFNKQQGESPKKSSPERGFKP